VPPRVPAGHPGSPPGPAEGRGRQAPHLGVIVLENSKDCRERALRLRAQAPQDLERASANLKVSAPDMLDKHRYRLGGDRANLAQRDHGGKMDLRGRVLEGLEPVARRLASELARALDPAGSRARADDLRLDSRDLSAHSQRHHHAEGTGKSHQLFQSLLALDTPILELSKQGSGLVSCIIDRLLSGIQQTAGATPPVKMINDFVQDSNERLRSPSSSKMTLRPRPGMSNSEPRRQISSERTSCD
jgi:hypothetical protein